MAEMVVAPAGQAVAADVRRALGVVRPDTFIAVAGGIAAL
jgi:hypothetical protein